MLRDLGDPGVRSWEGGKQRGSWPHGGREIKRFLEGDPRAGCAGMQRSSAGCATVGASFNQRGSPEPLQGGPSLSPIRSFRMVAQSRTLSPGAQVCEREATHQGRACRTCRAQGYENAQLSRN